MRLLDRLYAAGAVLAAVFLLLIATLTLAQVIGRMVGVLIPDAGDFAGYAMAAAGFLALAHTLKRNEHIRVTLILGRLQGRARRGLEIWALSAAVLLAALFAFYSVRLAVVSWQLKDISTGNDATPLWIPQLAMALGTVVLLVAFIDEWVMELRGRRRTVESAEALHNE